MAAAKKKEKKKSKRNNKKKQEQSPGRDSTKIPSWMITVFTVLATVAVVFGTMVAFYSMRRQVENHRNICSVQRFDSRMVNVAKWVPPVLARKGAATSLPPKMDFDHPDLCREVARRVAANPLIKSVDRVTRRRTGNNRVGVVTIDAEFRKAYAQVSYAGTRYYVDREGIRLPAGDVPTCITKDGKCYLNSDHVPPTARVRRIHYVVIYGVQTPPPANGHQWKAEDLQDGLRLVNLVEDRNYSNQITSVDVRNYRKRISDCEPELRMYAQIGDGRTTEIRFGRFPYNKDWVIPPARKLQYLDQYVHDNEGMLAGIHAYLDLRYDELHISSK